MAGAFAMGERRVKILDKTLEEKYEELEKRVAALEGRVQVQPGKKKVAYIIDEDFEQRVIQIIKDVVGGAFKRAANRN